MRGEGFDERHDNGRGGASGRDTRRQTTASSTSHSVGSILDGPAAAYLKQMTGNWKVVFIIVAALDIVVAVLAITALRTMRARHIKAG